MAPAFHKIGRKTFKNILSGLHFTTFEIIMQLYNLEVEIVYNSVKKFFRYFSLPDRIIKAGDILDF